MATGYQGYGSGYGDPERAKMERSRQMAELLQQNALQTQPTNLVTGLASLGEAWIARNASNRADKAENTYATDKARRLAQYFNPNADDQGRNLAPDVNVGADPAPAPAQADPRIRSIAQHLGGVYEGDGKTQPVGMTAAPMADVGEPSFTVGAPVSQPMRPAMMPKPAPDRTAALRQAMQMTGGDLGQAAALVEAKLGAQPRQQFLQGPDGAISLGNLDDGTIKQLQPGTPKPVDPAKAPEVNSFGQMWDGKQWVTVPGALDNYGRMHPGDTSGGGQDKPPSGYRRSADGQGLEPIPGGPADRGKGAALTPEEIRLEREFSKDWKTVFTDWKAIDTQYNNLGAMARQAERDPENASAADLALIVGFTKMQDPGSVAREGEVALTQQTVGVMDQVGNLMNQWQNGKTVLPASARQNIMRAAEELHRVYGDAYHARAQDYQKSASDYGFDPGRVMMGYQPPAPVKPKPNVAQTAINGIGDVVKGVGGAFANFAPRGGQPTQPGPDLSHLTDEQLQRIAMGQ